MPKELAGEGMEREPGRWKTVDHTGSSHAFPALQDHFYTSSSGFYSRQGLSPPGVTDLRISNRYELLLRHLYLKEDREDRFASMS